MSISSKISRKRGLKKDMELRTSIIKLLIIYKGVGKRQEHAGKIRAIT
jgi:hypothetical protein